MSDAKWPAMLPEHAANPFVAALGPIPDYWGNLGLFDRRPAFAEAELELPPHLRRYCITRLFGLNEALERQATLAERIGMVIRMGYEGRDPAKELHHAAILDSVERLEAGKEDLPSPRSIEPTAVGLSLLGHPGMGKSRSVQIVLDSLPRAVRHAIGYSVVQVPWLLVQCQSLPSRKGLCIAILTELGKRVGVDYVGLIGAHRMPADSLVLQVQNKLVVHAVGLLVIDEVQNLERSREGSLVVMNFLVMLVNTAGIPVLLVGTMSATSVVQQDFRGARRAVGLGSLIWERLRPGPEWDQFFSALMRWQWTRERTPLGDGLTDAFYDECQGILSMAVTLMVLVQFRATQLGEVRGEPELITPGLVRTVASEEFTVIRPMLDALRAGTDEAVAAYPDLEHFGKHVDNVVARGLGCLPGEVRHRPEQAAPQAVRDDDPAALLLLALRGRGVGPDVADRILAEARAKNPSGDAFELIEAAARGMQGVETRFKGTRARRPASPAAAGSDDPLDLRSLVRAAREAAGPEKASAYRALADAGLVSPVAGILGG